MSTGVLGQLLERTSIQECTDLSGTLTEALDAVFADMQGYYGRLDVKFRDVDSLQADQILIENQRSQLGIDSHQDRNTSLRKQRGRCCNNTTRCLTVRESRCLFSPPGLSAL